MIHVVIVAAIIVVFAAGLCGHVAQPFPLTSAWRTVQAWRTRETRRAPAGATNSPSSDSADARPAPRPSRGRTATRPMWAHSQPLDYDEAA